MSVCGTNQCIPINILVIYQFNYVKIHSSCRMRKLLYKHIYKYCLFCKLQLVMQIYFAVFVYIICTQYTPSPYNIVSNTYIIDQTHFAYMHAFEGVCWIADELWFSLMGKLMQKLQNKIKKLKLLLFFLFFSGTTMPIDCSFRKRIFITWRWPWTNG